MDLALFDFDGTITASDSYSGFLRFAVPRHRVVLGLPLLAPALVSHRLGLIPARAARPIVSAAAFRVERVARIRELGRRYAAEVLPGVVRPRALERIRWHQARGDAVVVVSASLDVYLRPWCNHHGVEVICTELEERNGILTGR